MSHRDSPEGWVRQTLGELCELYQPKTVSKAEMVEDGEYPVYGANGVIGRLDRFNHADPEVLLACRGNVGTVNMSQACSWVNGNAMVCRPKSGQLSKVFLGYLLTGIDLRPAISGTAQLQITRRSLAPLVVPVPPLEEQERIVALLEEHLSRHDAALANIRAVRTKAAQFRRSLLHAAFAGLLTGSATERGELPDDWITRPLVDLVQVLDSLRVPVNSKDRAERTGDVPYYGATGQVGTIDEAIFDEDLLLLGEDGVQFFDPDKPKAYEISGPAWVNNHAHVLRADEGVMPRRLLLHYLNQFDYRGSANGTTRLKLTQGAMKQIPVVVPPSDEQRQILQTLDAQLSRLEATLAATDRVEAQCAALRRSLLHAAFKGKLTEEWRETAGV